jgi:hypothetical protein
LFSAFRLRVAVVPALFLGWPSFSPCGVGDFAAWDPPALLFRSGADVCSAAFVLGLAVVLVFESPTSAASRPWPPEDAALPFFDAFSGLPIDFVAIGSLLDARA